ncbi:MAG: hypothetical protein KFH98_04670 [Gemmatimonadetes bacterium]|nr:hypothetical protein [Gemmatimonadota bacterium]
MSRATLHIAAACCVLAGCNAEPEPADSPPPADPIAADSVFDPVDDQVNLPTASIYYTLTSYDWYARGEPLVHAGRPYEPDGMPLNVPLTEMQKAGEYQGVDYYTRATDFGPAVYVPVYEGYWQMFSADPSAVALPADDAAGVADPAAADTLPPG